MGGDSKHNTGEQETIEFDSFDNGFDSVLDSDEGLDSISGFFTLPEVHQTHDSREVMSAIPFASNRYQIQNQIGEGGMSQVFRVFDKVLNRTVAMKVIRPSLSLKPEVENKFYEEAQATAQLQHPAIVPVYDMGKLPNGQLYFTMKEVNGHTLRTIIRELHGYRVGAQWNETPNGWTFPRLVQAMIQVCEAMAHAHQFGVVHRDLKPENIMLGSHGEVMVLDWGIAQLRQVSFEQNATTDARETIILSSGSKQSRHGAIAGTPAYMAPEQASSEFAQIGPRSDIYSLGGIFYELLTGRTPRVGTSHEIIKDLVAGVAVRAIPTESWIPRELRELTIRMLNMNPEARPQNVFQISRSLRRWLEGAEKQERALELVRKAKLLYSEVNDANLRADQLSALAAREAARIPPYAGIEHRRKLWRKEDESIKARSAARLLELEMLEQLRTALNYDNACVQAHEGLAEYYHQRHQYCERNHMNQEAKTYEVLLRKHNLGRYNTYLEGLGYLSVHTDTSAVATLFKYVDDDRRLNLEPLGVYKELPIENLSLPMGSYLIQVRSESKLPLRLPISIERAKHFEVRAPNEEQTRPLRLLSTDEISNSECYVPQGWATVGAHENPDNPMRQVWVDGFIMQKYHVTNRQYLDFLNHLVRDGRLEDANNYAPAYWQTGKRQVIYGFEPDENGGFFKLVPDPQGDIWDLEWPVILVDYHGAMAYAKWYSEKSGHLWRLPTSLEWEKAARGVDGRAYPWGDYFEAIWARVRESVRPNESLLPVKVTDYPSDVSPYGICGLGGNAQDWCLEMLDNSPEAPIRGAAWSHMHAFAPLHLFRLVDKTVRTETASFRLVRSVN